MRNDKAFPFNKEAPKLQQKSCKVRVIKLDGKNRGSKV